MKPVAPDLGLGVVTIIAKDQPEYNPLPAEVFLKPGTGAVVLTRWEPTPEEREAFINGADLYIAILTFGKALQPHVVSVGDKALKEYLNA